MAITPSRAAGSRRRAPRLATSLGGRLAARRPHPVTVLDLSLTGCLVRCDALLEPGAILDLEVLLLPEPLHAKVRVADSSVDGSAGAARAEPYLAGLEFLGLAPRESDRLRRFLDEERRRRQRADAGAD